MNTEPDSLTIGAFAKAAGVNVETIRFYQLKGLLPTPDRPYGSIRRYSGADVARVKFVKAAQRLGFARQLFNDAVRHHNEAVQQFPTRLLAGLFGFGLAGPL